MSKHFSKIRLTLYSTITPIVALLLFSAPLSAQTPAENLQTAVEIYNAMREYCDVLSPKTLTQEEINDVKSRMDKGVPLLDKVIREGTAEEIRTSRYFKNNFRYEYGFILGMKGENAKAYEVFKDIDRDFAAYTASDFPMRYKFFDKNYVINWDNFAATQAEYLTGFGEICYNLNKYDDAFRSLKLAEAHPNMTNWLKYITINKLLDVQAKSPALMTEQEQLNYFLKAIKAYYALSEAEKKTVAEFDYPTIKRAVNNIVEKAEKNVPAAMAITGEAALATQSEKTNVKVLQLFELTYRNNQPVDYSFHQTAEKYARETQGLDGAKARYVGLAATDRMAAATGTSNCTALQTIIDQYSFWKENAKVTEYTKKRQTCLEDQEKAQKRAAKQAKRANRNFNLYTGVYLFPLMKSSSKRDYGGVVNFVFKKSAMEFSYLKINRNKENIFDMSVQGVSDAEQDDLSRWDGFYAHFHPKFFSNKGAYVGPLFGYAQKTFEPFTASYTDDVSGTFGSATFEPTVKQYILMANFGGLGLGKGFGGDFYMGIGATYNQWEWGSELNNDNITVDNPVLENREDNFFGLIIRVGMTIGLNFGRGNL